ncbi:MAG: hypothetical protein BWY04_00475 [candidate division CPR1 bacterium ADurb.Bin160]|uniref:Uncharacterized protein n=1 Tax=candidate division CPR1 bacterium ADurb.Bin160 TaxID=1852826 RepID=A0A1V5ZP18_9BACT|nr:MAG: hypothetical protein BWY04_00475 [candidate division CPR1 bacterium ADurb.Bin160]
MFVNSFQPISLKEFNMNIYEIVPLETTSISATTVVNDDQENIIIRNKKIVVSSPPMFFCCVKNKPICPIDINNINPYDVLQINYCKIFNN